jgi:ABC-type protease/lipase transport system fused ATPase/permease subunit
MILFLVGLVLGMIAVVSLEVAVLLYVLKRLIRNTTKSSPSSVDSNSSLDLQQSLDFAYNKMV